MARQLTVPYVCVFCVLTSGRFTVGQAITVERVLDAWQTHLARIKTAEFSLVVEESLPRGAFNKLAELYGIKESLPRESASVMNNVTIVFANPRVFVETEGSIFDLNQAAYVPRRDRIAFDGKTTTQLTEQLADTNRKQGFLSDGSKDVSSLGLVHFGPLLWFLRLYSWDSSATGQWSEIELKKAADELVVYHRPTKENIFLDASRGFRPLKFSRRIPGKKKAWEIDVVYSEYGGFGWVPTEWNATIDNGQAIKHVTCKVTNLKINHDVPNESFAIHFPTGTKVLDRRGNSRLQLISDGGNLVPIGRNSRWLQRIIIYIAAAVLLIAIVVASRLQKFRKVNAHG